MWKTSFQVRRMFLIVYPGIFIGLTSLPGAIAPTLRAKLTLLILSRFRGVLAGLGDYGSAMVISITVSYARGER